MAILVKARGAKKKQNKGGGKTESHQKTQQVLPGTDVYDRALRRVQQGRLSYREFFEMVGSK